MSEPANPAGPPPDPAPTGQGAPRGATHESAAEAVRLVISWYNEQIIKERRAADCDEGHLEHLMAQRQACVADQHALQDAGPQETDRIAARYAARYRELTGQ